MNLDEFVNALFDFTQHRQPNSMSDQDNKTLHQQIVVTPKKVNMTRKCHKLHVTYGWTVDKQIHTHKYTFQKQRAENAVAI